MAHGKRGLAIKALSAVGAAAAALIMSTGPAAAVSGWVYQEQTLYYSNGPGSCTFDAIVYPNYNGSGHDYMQGGAHQNVNVHCQVRIGYYTTNPNSVSWYSWKYVPSTGGTTTEIINDGPGYHVIVEGVITGDEWYSTPR